MCFGRGAGRRLVEGMRAKAAHNPVPACDRDTQEQCHPFAVWIFLGVHFYNNVTPSAKETVDKSALGCLSEN